MLLSQSAPNKHSYLQSQSGAHEWHFDQVLGQERDLLLARAQHVAHQQVV
jgi:hypothetical protein